MCGACAVHDAQCTPEEEAAQSDCTRCQRTWKEVPKQADCEAWAARLYDCLKGKAQVGAAMQSQSPFCSQALGAVLSQVQRFLSLGTKAV